MWFMHREHISDEDDDVLMLISRSAAERPEACEHTYLTPSWSRSSATAAQHHQELHHQRQHRQTL